MLGGCLGGLLNVSGVFICRWVLGKERYERRNLSPFFELFISFINIMILLIAFLTILYSFWMGIAIIAAYVLVCVLIAIRERKKPLDAPASLGTKCTRCGSYMFSNVCPKCGHEIEEDKKKNK